MTDNNSKRTRDRDDWWVVVAGMGLLIPIIGVSGGPDSDLAIIIGVIAVIAALTLVARSLMTHRHRLRLVEIEARERMLRAERDQLSTAERILELDEAIKKPPDKDVEPPHTA